MAAIKWQDVVEGIPAPELSTIGVLAQDYILAHVNGSGIDVSGYGGETSPKTRLARAYLAAHMATMARRRGIPGFRSEQHAGPVGESFAMPPIPMFLGEFAMTSYGTLFASITRGSAHRAGILV